MSLEEYEAQLAEKKAALNKPAEKKAVDMAAFEGLKTYVRVETADQVEGLELTNKKAMEAAEATKQKARKQVCRQIPSVRAHALAHACMHGSCMHAAQACAA